MPERRGEKEPGLPDERGEYEKEGGRGEEKPGEVGRTTPVGGLFERATVVEGVVHGEGEMQHVGEIANISKEEKRGEEAPPMSLGEVAGGVVELEGTDNVERAEEGSQGDGEAVGARDGRSARKERGEGEKGGLGVGGGGGGGEGGGEKEERGRRRRKGDTIV